MTALDHLGWVVNRSYAVGGFGFGVRTTSKEFGEWLDRALALYRVEGVEAVPHFSIVIADESPDGRRAKERYHILYRGTLAIAKTPDLRTMVVTLLSDMASFVYDQRDDAIYLDMVPVSLGDTTGLVPAILPPYLVTLGRRRIERSGLVLGAETAVSVSLESGMVEPMTQFVQLSDRAMESLAEVAPLDGPDPRTVVQSPFDTDVVFSIGWRDEVIIPVSRGLALFRLGSHVANLEHLGVKAITGLKPIVERARAFELGSGKPAQMLDGLLTALRAP